MTCSRCQAPTHHDIRDGREHCSSCERVPAFCRCQPATVQRRPLWLERSLSRPNGLARDESGSVLAA